MASRITARMVFKAMHAIAQEVGYVELVVREDSEFEKGDIAFKRVAKSLNAALAKKEQKEVA